MVQKLDVLRMELLKPWLNFLVTPQRVFQEYNVTIGQREIILMSSNLKHFYFNYCWLNTTAKLESFKCLLNIMK